MNKLNALAAFHDTFVKDMTIFRLLRTTAVTQQVKECAIFQQIPIKLVPRQWTCDGF